MGKFLFLAFVVVPLVELYVIIQVGRVVGAGWTVLALLVISIVGAALVKREGVRAWTRFTEAIAAGRVPAMEVVDGALLLVAGAFLLTPGFVTDAVGLALLFSPSRALVNRGLRGRVSASFLAPPGVWRRRRPEQAPGDAVIDVEVVQVERDDERGRGQLDPPP